MVKYKYNARTLVLLIWILDIASQIYCNGGQQEFGRLASRNAVFQTTTIASSTLSPSSPSSIASTTSSKQPNYLDNGQIFLESMEDLEHVAYLSLRNFNLTDQNLEQSNPSYKRSDLEENADGRTNDDSGRHRLALMLESFIYHLRKDHLRRLELDELKAIAKSMNIEPSGDDANTINNNNDINNMDDKHQVLIPVNNENQPTNGKFPSKNKIQVYNKTATLIESTLSKNVQSIEADEAQPSIDRCHYLVKMYRFELESRYWSNLASVSTNGNSNTQSSVNSNDNERLVSANISIATNLRLPDTRRLLKLCRLVVDCQSAEDFLNIITGPWTDNSRQQQLEQSSSGIIRDTSSGRSPLSEPLIATNNGFLSGRNENYQRRRRDRLTRQFRSSSRNELEIEQDLASTSNKEKQANSGNFYSGGQRDAKTLRESLSRSLAKLCPLILFQLHDSEGHCTANRDDQPPMIAVWAFATLFVTIVSFCSLIGLSITPLLGQSATSGDDSSGNSRFTDSSSSTSSSTTPGQKDYDAIGAISPIIPSSTANGYLDHRQQNRACLTLFEGLAVGSLVGSALFSLIPQAFELQDRESNQGFLLKALIIFFGIYLFFCSERIMRIILDTRQQRKRLKRANRRPSTSIPIQGGSGGFDSSFHQNPDHLQMVHFAHNSNNTASYSNNTRTSNRDRLNWRQKGLVAETNLSLAPQDHCLQKRITSPAKLTNSNKTNKRRSSSDILKSNRRSSEPSGAQSAKRRMRRRRARMLAAKLSKNTRRQAMINSRTDVKLQSSELDSDENSELWESYVGNRHRHSHNKSKSILRPEPLASATISLALDEHQDESSFAELSEFSCDDNYELSLGDGDDFDEDDDHGFNEFQRGRDDGIMTLRNNNNAKHRQQAFVRSSPLRATFYPSEWGARKNHESYYNHSNTVSQSDNVSQDISTVAWMIVLGDGLHNFIDGISIGAAFSESILSGVSISVAVICEEFPHELGDFAVLVSSGMTVRQALGYNFLSACTCYLGMAFGIILGDVDEGASYISALAAGVFLYIALVDMMGELSATLEKSSRGSIAKTLNLLLLQNVGIFIGISIIFVLSFIDF